MRENFMFILGIFLALTWGSGMNQLRYKLTIEDKLFLTWYMCTSSFSALLIKKSKPDNANGSLAS